MFDSILLIIESRQLEVFSIYVAAGLSILLRNVVYQAAWSDLSTRRRVLIFEFMCLVLPMVLVETILSAHTFITVAILIILNCAYFIVRYRTIIEGNNRNHILLGKTNDDLCSGFSFTQFFSDVPPKEAFENSIKWFRTMVLISTGVAILAVDFPVFPPHFGKSTTYGHSLMDTGTAAFVFLNALSDFGAVSKRGSDKITRISYIYVGRVKIPSIFLLLLCGLARCFYVAHFTAHKNFTEYGVYWNFYITLFFLRVFVMMTGYPRCILVGIIIGIGYELALLFYGLEEWILRDDKTSPRVGIIDENREGIFSMFGYIFLYSLSLVYAKFISSVLLRKKNSLIYGIFVGFTFSWCCLALQLYLENYYSIASSRRVANLTYVLSMLWLFTVSLPGLQSFNLLVAAPVSPSRFTQMSLLEAISRNALTYFIVANIFTALVNLMELPKTNYLSSAISEALLIVLYSLMTSLVVYYVNVRRNNSIPSRWNIKDL
ncbi:GWT1 domain-containing protein [Ditylenchus destructor]|uniref:Phosphatidylinositol-glycan biosynthesis class W protein n=1 Tax=Ditylenchus destructor TaxID=166010 RepID=A0AAD4R1X0_9BILA|nr:GWT1 domain-containing protein [Ditylenchus destructor]